MKNRLYPALVSPLLPARSICLAEATQPVRVAAITREKINFRVRTYDPLAPRVEEMSLQNARYLEAFEAHNRATGA